MSNKTYDTIIIGAGWSGAIAAKELTSKGHSVLVLEARDRIGGRARTWSDNDKNTIDLGCSWIHGYKEGNPAKGLANDLGINAMLPQPAEGLVYGPDGPLSSSQAASLRSSLSSAQEAFKLPHPSPASTTSLASALLSSSSPLFKSDSKYSSDPSTNTVDSTSPANPSEPTSNSTSSVDQSLAEGLARTLEIPLGLKLENVSLKWSGWESTTSFAGSDAAPEGGYQSFVEKVLKSGKVDIKLNQKVQSIKDTSNGVEINTANGEKYEGKTVISTIPLAVLKTLPSSFVQPELSPKLQSIIKGTNVGTLEKLLVKYDKAWWPNSTEVGSYTFLPTSNPNQLGKSSSLEDIFNGSSLVTANFASKSSTLSTPQPILLTYLSETPAKLLLEHPKEEVIKAFHEFLVKRLQPKDQVNEPVEGELTDWLKDEYSLGATTTPTIVSENDERSPMDFKELGRPVWKGRLGFAGEHTEMEHRGSVAGAIVSGLREAERVDRLLNLLKE
ncbi:amino oxidase [Kwoniella mangroviensis CBS 8886]|nr:amino oxidase [Kwoniella mangroviensis CBS 8886]